MNSIALTILEATITLYVADPSGAPITSQPIWTGVQADQVEISDRWLKTETRPTGAKYPKRHPLVPQYQIDISRVWALPLNDLVSFRPARNNYVLDVVWVDEDTGNWHRELFYGVTISDRSRGSRALEGNAGEFVEHQVFDAQEMIPTSGTGTPPVIDADLPYIVRYVGIDGRTQNIYTYDPTAFTFTAIGDPTSLATLTNGTTFQVTFAGSVAPEMEVSSSGITATQFRTGAPTANNVPRVDFYYGTSRVASVTRWGEVFAQSYYEGIINPQNRPGVFQLTASNGSLLGTIEQQRITANAYTSFTPDSVSGLKLWCGIESFAATPEGTRISQWPDLSTNNNPLVQSNPANQPLLTRATVDSTSGLPMDGLPSLLFDADLARFMTTLQTVLATRQFTVFVLTWGQDSNTSYSLLDTMASGNTMADYDFLASITSITRRYKAGGSYHILVYYGDYRAATGVDNTMVGNSAILPHQWNIIEMQLSGGVLSGAINSVQNWSGTLSGSLATSGTADSRQIVLGDAAGLASINGYVRALLVYDTPPSDSDKQKIRKYLGLLYSTPATINDAPVDGSTGVTTSNAGRDVSQ